MKKSKACFTRLVPLCLLLLPFMAQAAGIAVGKPVPPVGIDDRGEIIAQADGKDTYQPWHSTSMQGKFVILQHMAARLSSKSIMQSFNDAMERKAYPPEKVLVVVVINLDDALWGTTGFVQSELKGNKRKHPQSIIVADKKGLARKAWDLRPKNAAMAVLDATGTVLFFNEGSPTAQQTRAVFDMIEAHLQAAAAPPPSI